MLGKGREAEEKSFLQHAASSQSVQQNHRLKPFPFLVSTSAFASGTGTNTLSCGPLLPASLQLGAVILAIPLLGCTAAPSGHPAASL